MPVALVAIAGVACIWSALLRDRDELIFAANALPNRSVDARVDEAIDHRPTLPRIRSANNVTSDLTALRLSSVAADANATGDRHREAVALLLSGKRDRAANILDGMVAPEEYALLERIERITDVALLNALTAAHYAMAQHEGRAEDLMIATAAAARAHRLDTASVIAAWNYALCLSTIGLAEEAREAWRGYLELDPQSSWSAEAKERLAELTWKPEAVEWEAAVRAIGAIDSADPGRITALAKRFPIRMKSLVERDWISMWADAVVMKKMIAPRVLESIAAAAIGVQAAMHDRQLLDFVTAARSAPDLIKFAMPHIELARIQMVLREKGTAEAIDVAERCHRELLRVHSPSAATVSVNLAGLLYNASRHSSALKVLNRADAEIDAARWRLLAARAAWNRGVALTSLGDITRADVAFRRTIELYRGDPTHNGFLQMLLGENADLAQNVEATWTYYVEGLRQAERYGDPERVLVVIDTFARVALRNGHYGFAAILANAIDTRAKGDANLAPFVCRALTVRCEIENRIGERDAARTHCAKARGVFASVADAAVRDRLEGDLEIASATVEDHNTRIENLTRAVDVSERRRDLFRLSRVLLLRARAYVAAGATIAARTDLERGLEVVEEQRARLVDIRDKVTYFDTARGLAVELVRLLVRSGEPMEALRVVETVRARALVERMSGASTKALSVESIRTSLTTRQAVLEYWADERELFVWIIRTDGVTFVRRDTARRSIALAADEFIAALSDDQATAIGTTLGDMLFAPAARMLAATETITIIPDDVFAHIPFAALPGPDGRLVVEAFAIHSAPSATALTLVQAPPRNYDSLLVIANPRTAEPLPPLEVRAEIDAAARVVRRAVIRKGSEATPDMLRRSARDFGVLHFASHGFDGGTTGEPAIALTPDGDDADGLLTASDVERLSLRTGTLVVLASCRTLRGPRSSDGTMSMARAFTAAGARSVLASAWDVGDSASSRLLSAFYKSLAEGTTPSAALRAAQLALIRNRQPASVWAAYQLYGGK